VERHSTILKILKRLPNFWGQPATKQKKKGGKKHWRPTKRRPENRRRPGGKKELSNSKGEGGTRGKLHTKTGQSTKREGGKTSKPNPKLEEVAKTAKKGGFTPCRRAWGPAGGR